MYSYRVLVGNTATAAPLQYQHETSGSETTGKYSCRVLKVNTAPEAPLTPNLVQT